MKCVLIKIQGIVQGVGFRPFVKQLADKMGLAGYVINTSFGVEIKACGVEEQLEDFVDCLKSKAPAVSHIVSIDTSETVIENFIDFSIKPSQKFEGKITLVSPDLAICKDCIEEIKTVGKQRFRYPFTNCTNCGPRYSITESLPYDRPNTVMKVFNMCITCKGEYSDKSDRRFHAQPIACSLCGPEIKLNFKGNIITDTTEALQKAAEAVDAGEIIAMKGLGGYHLICDAYNDNAINKLRKIKRRHTKPFAVMVRDEKTLDKYVKNSNAARDIFLSPASPVTLFEWDHNPLSNLINPAVSKIGVMRAYTPLHYIFFDFLKTDVIVATSGNLRDEPIASSEEEAEKNLGIFTDIFLHHNREIFNRIDDSVVSSIENGYTVLRRARGFAPFPVVIKAADKDEKRQIFAAGANLKSSIAFYKDGFAFLSQYIGDLDNVETENFYGEVFNRMQSLFGIKATMGVKDMHPTYRSSLFTDALGLPVKEVQHHVAHFASCLCENSWYDDAIGVVMDGFGLAADKKSGWGGEFFLKKGLNIYRKGHLRPFLQPGLDAAAKHPCRMAFSYIYTEGLLGKYENFFKTTLQMDKSEQEILKGVIDNKINAIYTTSAGRLFEAVGSIVLGERSNGYEGELAINLENIATQSEGSGYFFPEENGVINQGQVFSQIMDDIENGLDKSVISAKFHNGFATAISDLCVKIARDANTQTVALSGGVFQNIYLLEAVSKGLLMRGLTPLIHKKVPASDQGVALGQLFVVLLNLVLKL